MSKMYLLVETGSSPEFISNAIISIYETHTICES